MPADMRATEPIAAAKSLAHHLWHGYVGQGVHRVPIAGDTTKLPDANGLSPPEKRLVLVNATLRNICPVRNTSDA